MWCLIILGIIGVAAFKNLRDAGFFGAAHTRPPDVEIAKIGGPGGVVFSGTFKIPSLTADIDSQYSGRTSTNYATANTRGDVPQELMDYFGSLIRSEAQIIARSLDSGASIVNKSTAQVEPTRRKLGIV
jgi:hypothetical protein